MTNSKLFLLCGSFSGCLGVVSGAFGAHALRSRLSVEMLSVFKTGVQYHLIHSVVLLAIGLLIIEHRSNLLTLAGYLILAGIVLFSGSLYLLSMTAQVWAGPMTPLGGLLLIAGWFCVFLCVLRLSV